MPSNGEMPNDQNAQGIKCPVMPVELGWDLGGKGVSDGKNVHGTQ